MHRDTQRGFTVIELLAVVAILAILAVIVIPMFMKDASRGKAKSEVSAVFAELATRLDQYKAESPTNNYVAPTLACPSSPTTGDGTNTATDSGCADTVWTDLRVTWPSSKLHCSYKITTGAGGTLTPAPAAWVTASPQPALATPATKWYYLYADCPASDYFSASWDSKLRAEDNK